MKYAIDDKPPLLSLFLYGLQWWVVSLPCIVIMGLVVSRLHYTGFAEQSVYMQKLFGIMGLATIAQTLWGHRLPLVVGPASTLLVGIIASVSSGVAAIYTAIIIGGAVLAIASFSGLLHRLRFFFTPRIVAVILILIAFTLSPTILRLILDGVGKPSLQLLFAICTVFGLVLCNTLLPGVWKSLTVLIGIAGGSFSFFLAFGFPVVPSVQETQSSLPLLLPSLEFHAGTITAFMFCYLALLINELGSIESIGHMLRAENMSGRITRGSGLQGIANMASGGLGVIGPVDYSMSAGIISATGCASRYPLIPAGIGLALCAFFPGVVQMLSCIPSTVMGALMLYLMASQLSSGLSMLVADRGVTDFSSGLTVGLPLMIGLLIAFMPEQAFAGLPEILRPIVANGFVMGAVTVIVLEHGLFRSRKTPEEK